MTISKQNFKNIILNLTLLFPLILNNSTFSQQLIIFFFFLTAYFFGNFSISIFKIIFLILLVLSISLNSANIELKNVLRILQLVLGFMVFPLNFTSENINIKLLRIAILYIFIITFFDILNFQFFFDFRNYFYPSDVDPWSLAFDHSIISFTNRYGSIFYNPNLLGQSMLLVYIFYLLLKFRKPFNKFDIFFILLNVFCIIVSGSRTAFVILSLISFFYFNSFFKKRIKYIFLIIGLPYVIKILSNTRLLNIGNNNGDSMDQKKQILIGYLNSLSFNLNDVMQFLFGWLKLDIQFDNDIGNMIYFLGILGFLYMIIFYLYEFFISKNKIKYFYSFLLISYGATLLINFKFFIFTILLLSLLRSINKDLNFPSN
jgi:hypothetical protein